MEYDIVDRSEIVESMYVNPKFPNNFILYFLYNFKEYISTMVPRHIKYAMITTYRKGIEHIHKKEDGIDLYSQQYPAMIIQPGPLKLDERINNPWHSMNQMSERIMTKHYKPYVTMGNLAIYPVTNRFIFNFDVHYLAESYMELIDVILHMNRRFNNRYQYFNRISTGYMFLPEKLITFIKENYTEEVLTLSNDCALVYSSTYNRELYAIPWNFSAHIKLVDHSDGSNYMGDTELPTYRVTFNFEAMFQMPNHIVSTYNPSIDAMSFELNTQGSVTDGIFFADLMRVDLDAKEAILLHIIDFSDPFEIVMNNNQIPNWLHDFYGVKVNIISGKVDVLSESEFQIEELSTAKKFKISGVDSTKYFVNILGKYD